MIGCVLRLMGALLGAFLVVCCIAVVWAFTL